MQSTPARIPVFGLSGHFRDSMLVRRGVGGSINVSSDRITVENMIGVWEFGRNEALTISQSSFIISIDGPQGGVRAIVFAGNTLSRALAASGYATQNQTDNKSMVILLVLATILLSFLAMVVQIIWQFVQFTRAT